MDRCGGNKMIGAIEFLRKRKALCGRFKECTNCPARNICSGEGEDEAEYVRLVMDYQIKEESHE